MATQRHRAEPARCRVASGEITWPARSWLSNFGFAPTIHPLPPNPTGIGVCQLDSVEVTLSFREKLPIPETPQKTRNRVLIVGRLPSFRNAADCRNSLRSVNGILLPN
jgi:hypothetical protein